MIVGCLILILEHLFYKYTLPILRHQPKGTIWRSRNIMFFSQVNETQCTHNYTCFLHYNIKINENVARLHL